MAFVALAAAGALAANAQRKRSRQITDIEDGPAFLPETDPAGQREKLYDPLRRGPRWATDWLANRALHGRKRYPQPYTRPLHDNGQSSVLVRAQVGPEAAARMQHIYAETLPEGPPFFARKTVELNRQVQPFRMPSIHPGLTTVDATMHEFNRWPMPYNYPAGHALA
jgi:hypothetical protein